MGEHSGLYVRRKKYSQFRSFIEGMWIEKYFGSSYIFDWNFLGDRNSARPNEFTVVEN